MITKKSKFINLCCNGNLAACKAFYELNTDINISAENECAFRWACSNGYLVIAKWLLKIKSDINISAENEYAFRWACYKGHFNVVRFLKHYVPYYDYKYVLNLNYCRKIELIWRSVELWDLV